MAFKTFGSVPFPPLRIVNRDSAIDGDWLLRSLQEWDNRASILIRSERGAPKRGGYFFHLSRTANGFQFHDFAGGSIINLTKEDAPRLINHATGRSFDPEMLTLCQRAVNLRQDD